MPDPKEKRIRHRLQRHCVSCENFFYPHQRLGTRQKTCGKESCRRKHRAGYRRKYRLQNPESEREYEQKRRTNRCSDYWRRYRHDHPTYSNRNRAQARLRNQLLKAGLQRQLDIVQLIDPTEKLEAVVGFATSHRSLLEQCLCRMAA